MDFQATNNWRITGRYMKNSEDILQAYGTTWAGNGSDHLPMPVLFVHPGSNYMLSGTGILNSTTTLELSWGRAANSLNYQLQNPDLFRAAAGLSSMPLIYPTAVQADYIPDFRFRGGRTANAGFYQTDRGPFTNENITHDVIANLTKVWGAHASKAGFYFQHSFKPQSIFASFNSQIDFTDNASNPFDTGYSYANAATGVFNTYTQASKYALPEWRYKNWEFYAQDNWKPTSRLTLDYGVRFYYLTPQWDTTLQASNFLPDEFNPAPQQSSIRQCASAGPLRNASNRRGMDPALIAAGVAPTMANTVEERFIGRLTPGSDRFNGSFQAGQGINDQLQDGAAFRVSPRVGVVYDLTGKGTTILRGGWGIFYDRPQGNMVFDMIANAPGVLNSQVQWGRLQTLATGGGDPESDAVPQSNRLRLQAPEGRRSGTWASSTRCGKKSSWTSPTWAPIRPTCCGSRISTRFRLVRRWRRRTRIPPAPRRRSWGPRRCRMTSCARTGATAASGCGTTADTGTTTRSSPR